MYEKISNKPIREEKVKKLKTKILKEIDKELYIIKDEIKSCLLDDNADFDYLVRTSFALLNLKDFIKSEGAFQSYMAEYCDKDIIIYTVSDRNLEIWLQDDYNFGISFLHKAERCGFNVFPLLNDHSFEFGFTNYFDGVAYDKKIKEKKLEQSRKENNNE